MKPQSTTKCYLKLITSQYSQTAFKIIKAHENPLQKKIINNDYSIPKHQLTTFQSKRLYQKDRETTKYESAIRKKTIHQNSFSWYQKDSDKLDFGRLLDTLGKEEENYFIHDEPQKTIYTNDHQMIKKYITFPNYDLPQLQESKNELLTKTIEIMSNKNEKLSIPIHEGLYNSNVSNKNDNFLQNPQLIPNLCNFKMKNQYSNSIQFISDYKSGYTPIQMQKKNNQEFEDLNKQNIQTPSKNNKDKSRNHFIRKQQSTLSLPRTCGVSYIKPSQSLSTQKPPFQPLPPLIFQGSTSCSIGFNGQNILSLNQEENVLIQQFTSLLQNQWLPFIFSQEDEMRDLLLNKKTKKAKAGFVKGVQNLWPLFTEGSFILIVVSPQKITNQSQIWQAFQKKSSYFKIGILSKKSTSGKKAFLKSIKSQQSDITSVASFETNHNQKKYESTEQKLKLTNQLVSYQSKISISLRDSPEEQKIINTFEILEEQLKDSRTVITMGLRLEMYVQQDDWKYNFTKENKEMLNQIIINLKQRLEKKSIKIIYERFQLAKSTKMNYFQHKFDFLRIGKQKNSITQTFNSITQTFNSITQTFNLKPNKQTKNLFNTKNKNLLESLSFSQRFIIENTNPCAPSHFLTGLASQQSWKKTLKFPLYYISTRDSFAFDLIEKKTTLRRQNGREYTKITYYFYPDNVPTNFSSEYKKLFPDFAIGITAYHDFFSEQELINFQKNTFQMEKNAFRNKFTQMTVQPSIVSTKIKRTKFFFGYRYMWTRCQLSEPFSYVGAGVRKDVAPPPHWTKDISDEMVKQNLVEKDFINSIAINVYHDGKQGLAQHFDDAVRFKQPIYTLRLFSDARLSFGSQFYGFCNGAFIIPLPRGCILVMQENSYAANGVKHCVRPCDMTGKSAAVILRQMHSQVVVIYLTIKKSEASRFDELIDFPAWLSCLSENENSITFSQQKRLQAMKLMAAKEN